MSSTTLEMRIDVLEKQIALLLADKNVDVSDDKPKKKPKKLPARPAVSAMPKIIISHVIVAAAARLRGAVAVASRASSEVPDAPTPMPISAYASTDSTSASA